MTNITKSDPRSTPRSCCAPARADTGPADGREATSPTPRDAPRMGFLDKMRVATPAPPPGAAIDPVCHMKVDPAHAAGKSEHEGKTYHFCSAGCKSRFDAAPAKYLASSGPHGM